MSANSRCLILAGPTREYIDPVRYISNASSGLQGMALAEEALGRGYEVELVLGPVEYAPPAGAAVTNVVSAAEMLAAARERHPDCAVLIGAAAVSDFRPETSH
ncbi:MAG: phosphopantothenoylcysteine decarboxylase, partial [Planctomycetes bacterium]|nr:phosphopantothenoylcysteine decarboxylase [Planctomycetota bacterium]